MRLKTLIISLILFYSIQIYANLPVFDDLNFAQLVLQLTQLQSQTVALQSQLKQLNKDNFDWGRTQYIINQLEQIQSEKDSIANRAMNLDQKFQENYPGYVPPKDFNKEYKTNVNMTQDTIRGSLKSMRESSNDFHKTNERLQTLQAQSEKAEGQVQAIQVSNKLAAETVSQIELLRQTVMTQSSAQSAYYATQIQKEASAQAELKKVIEAGSTTVPKYGSSGHYLTTPDF